MKLTGFQFKNLKIRTQILILTLSGIVILSCFIGFYLLPKVGETIEERTADKLESMVDIPYGITARYYAAFKSGAISEDEAKSAAMDEIRSLRYSGEDYFWINDYSPTMVMHPIKPEMDGENLANYADPEGKLIFVEFTNVVKNRGAGIVKYQWPKPGMDLPQPKMSYVKGFPEWGWVIGTGIYIDDLAAVQSTMMNNIMMVTAAIALICTGISYTLSGAISRPVKALNAFATAVAEGNMDAEPIPPLNNEIGELSTAFIRVVKTVKSVITETESLVKNITDGRLNASANGEQFSGGWRTVIEGVNRVADTLEGHIRRVPAVIMAVDKELNVLYLNDAGTAVLGMDMDRARQAKCYDLFKTEDCRTDRCACTRAIREGRNAKSETIARPNGMQLDIAYEGIPLKNREDQVIGAIELVVDQTAIRNAARVQEKASAYQDKEVGKLIESLETLADGKLQIALIPEPFDQDTAIIAHNFEKIYGSLAAMVDAMNAVIHETTEILSEMSQKNMDVEITSEYKGDFVEMKLAINRIIEALNDVLGDIGVSSEQVAAGSGQVADGSQALSQGATEQASAVEELTASITQVAAQTKQNAVNAAHANELASHAKDNANMGHRSMKDMLKSMEDINDSSKSISKIIKVIDEIAFQTNILALNAAVEAARAGQHGKGFAVVAEEVRNLAARSANAAKETTVMIEGSIGKVADGTRIANETALALSQIVEGIAEAAVLVGEIASASNEQANAIFQINKGVEQVSQVVQHNSATAQQSAAASEELNGQAQMLKDLVSGFSLKPADSGKRLNTTVSTKDKRLGSTPAHKRSKKNGQPDVMIGMDESGILLSDPEYGKYSR